jgi:hypothetical protein
LVDGDPACQSFTDALELELREQPGGECGPFSLASLKPADGLSCPSDTDWVEDNGGCSRARTCFYNLGDGLVARMDALAHVESQQDAASGTVKLAMHYSDGFDCQSTYDVTQR